MGLTVQWLKKKITVNRQNRDIFNVNRQISKPMLAVQCLKQILNKVKL